jgi:putative oxidoreductase
MRRIFYTQLPCSVSAGILILRLALGVAFILHGWSKVQHPFNWWPDGPISGNMQALGAFGEFGGGILLVTGFLTKLGALAICCVMVSAYVVVHIPMNNPYMSADPKQPTFELVVAYFASAALILLSGPGKLSVDALLFKPKDVA